MTTEEMLEKVEDVRNELIDYLNENTGGFPYYEAAERAQENLNNAHHWLQEMIDAT